MSRSEKISQFGIMIVAVSALVVSVWQVKLAQEHNKISVKPLLRYFISGSSSSTAETLTVKNYGQGPAIFDSVTFSVDGKTYKSIMEAIPAAGQTGRYVSDITTFDPGDVLDEKSDFVMLKIDNINKTKPIKVKIVYRSLYDEVFTLEFDY